MVIEELSRESVLRTNRERMGLPSSGELMDDALLAALLRRAAGILCPCSTPTLIASVMEGLQFLVDDPDSVEKRLADVAGKLIIAGDLLELNQVTTDDPTVRSTSVFAAPPSFVKRRGGSVFILGIAPDEVTPLPSVLAARVTHEGVVRLLKPEPSEDLAGVLRDLGWLEFSQSAWLKSPRAESAIHLRETMIAKLLAQPASGAIADALILDPARDPRYYASRWVSPTLENGQFVARRPQAHGSPLWGFAAVTNGAVTKFLDLPLKGTRWRGCDVAWHLQLAIDDGLGRKQSYRRRSATGGAYLDFFSPLPLWAERRLAVLGHPAPREKCLFTYWIPEREVISEEEFLRERLWLVRED